MGKIIAEWVTTAFVKEGRFDVVERRLLSKVLSEQELAVSGMVNTNTATELGKLLGVKIVITGSVIKLSQQIEVNARIIDVENASIIAAENVRAIQTTKLEELVVEMSRLLPQFLI
jgi:curli biogenesis system outer membrane secretion channel CsgG